MFLAFFQELESLQTDILIAYASKWQYYHLSMRLLLICFKKLNDEMIPRSNTSTKARPPSTTSVKPNSHYSASMTTTSGEASEVEKAALNLWRTLLFEHFQDRLLAAALAKITEDRDNSFHQHQDQDSSASASHTNASASTAALGSDNISTATQPQQTLALDPLIAPAKDTTPHRQQKKDLWVPMGGDRLVAELVESILTLGATLPATSKLSIYQNTFEKIYISRLESYFTREMNSYIDTQGVTRGISLALLRLNQEELRASRYLHVSSMPKITASLHSVLIDAHKEAMLAEFDSMLKSDRKAHMNVLFSLLSRQENGCEDLKTALFDFIVKTSDQTLKALVDKASEEADQAQAGKPVAKRRKNDRGAAQNVSPTAYVDSLTQLYRRFSELVSEAFNEEPSFVTTMDRAYKDAVNAQSMCDDPSLGPELLARQSDTLLKKGATPLSETDLELKLQQLVTVFKYVDDKDIFQNFYSKLLAKRLISSASVSEDTERATIASLKSLCSSEFILRVQRMFTDIQTSKEATEKFTSTIAELPQMTAADREALSKQQSGSSTGEAMELSTTDASNSSGSLRFRPSVPLDFSVFVLTTGSWPMHERSDSFNVPEMVSEYLITFSQFYNTMHTGRKLNWLYNMHRGEMRLFFARKNYDVGATAFQLAALLAFDSPSQSKLSVDQLTVILGLPPAETVAIAKNLLDCKLFVAVSASEESAEVAPPSESEGGAADSSTPVKSKAKSLVHGGTLLSLNSNFANKKLKFKLPAPAPTDSAKAAAQAAAKEEIDGDRTQFLQAVIVRTMKTRKTLSHTHLVQEVLEQCRSRFKASIALIKRQIDSLIELEYLMRSKEKADMYQYCA